MVKLTRSADSGYESNDDEHNFCSKRTRITAERWILTTNDSDRPFKVKVNRASPFVIKKSPEKKFRRRIILCDDDLDETQNSSFSSISSESDDLDHFYNMKNSKPTQHSPSNKKTLDDSDTGLYSDYT